jgi:hypothetical protein
LIKLEGFRVIEISVSTNARLSGTSHYGVWNRLFKSFRDLLAIRWMKSRALRYEIAESINCVANRRISEDGRTVFGQA